MSQSLTTNKLIRSIKRRAMIPEDQSTFDDQDFLDIINEEINIGLTPYVLKTHEEYFVNFEEEEVGTQTNSDPGEFPIPYRAIGNKLRDVAIVERGGYIKELSRISLEDISDFQYYGGYHRNDVFYLRNDLIVIPNSMLTASDKIRKYFYIKPNSMVLESRGATITNIDRVNGVIELNKFPQNFATSPQIDFVQAKSPNKIISYDIDLSDVDETSKTITVATTDIPDRLVVGDYVNQRQETVVPQLPTELHIILAQRAACACLEALGDTEGLQNATVKLQQMEQNVLTLIDNRVEGAPHKILNRHSPLASSGSRNRNRRF